jgi:hypothetical protein
MHCRGSVTHCHALQRFCSLPPFLATRLPQFCHVLHWFCSLPPLLTASSLACIATVRLSTTTHRDGSVACHCHRLPCHGNALPHFCCLLPNTAMVLLAAITTGCPVAGMPCHGSVAHCSPSFPFACLITGMHRNSVVHCHVLHWFCSLLPLLSASALSCTAWWGCRTEGHVKDACMPPPSCRTTVLGVVRPAATYYNGSVGCHCHPPAAMLVGCTATVLLPAATDCDGSFSRHHRPWSITVVPAGSRPLRCPSTATGSVRSWVPSPSAS